MMAEIQRFNMNNGQVLWLDDPQRAWRVVSGMMNIYGVTAAASPDYRQMFLDTAGEGRVLFGIGAGSVRLMAIAAGTTVLESMSRTTLPEKDADLSAAIETWLAAIISGPENASAPRSFAALAPGETVRLTYGDSLRAARGIVWVRPLMGRVVFGSAPECDLPQGLAAPLVRNAWLVAEEDSEVIGLTGIDAFSSACMQDERDVWSLFDHCHDLFIRLMESWFKSEDQRDYKRLEEKRQLADRLLYSSANFLLRTDLPDMPAAVAIDGQSSRLLSVARVVAGYLGVSEHQVRLPNGVDNKRQDIVLIRSVLRLAGMQMRQVALPAGWHSQDNGPLFAFAGAERRLVALLPVSPQSYRLYDPDSPAVVTVNDALAADIDPVAFTAYAGLPGKALSLGGFFRFVVNKGWPRDIWAMLIISVVAGLIPILTPLITQTIFEDIIPITDHQGLMLVIQVMMVSAFATVGVDFARGVSFLRFKNKAGFAAEAALWIRLLSLPAAFFRRYEAGDLAQRMDSVGRISLMISNNVISAIFNTAFSFWSLLVMLYYSWKLTLAAVALLLLYFLISLLLHWLMLKAKRRLMDATGDTAGQVLQIFGGLNKFRLQGAEAQAFYLWSRRFGEQWKWNRAFRWRSNWQELLNAIQPVALSMLIFWLTMKWLTDDTAVAPFLTLPQFMGFNAALTGFNATLTGMMAVIGSTMDVVPQIERIRPILEAQPEASEDKAEAAELTGRIEVSNVSFRYAPDMPPVLRDVALTVAPGQFVAIVGSSGSGKSTLLRLLLGFEKPDSGSIYFDGQDLSELHIVSVRSQMGVVLQNGQLMAGDILTNIIGSLPLTIDDAWQAAEMVGLADDIRAMPMGLHTVISEGAANISGGQRQRILIARAIVHQPRLIIFDEATSALDNRTQAMVTESLDRLNATRIVVAHRLSTVINADVIYVLDKGMIVESGTYSDLMASKGLFAALAARQTA